MRLRQQGTGYTVELEIKDGTLRVSGDEPLLAVLRPLLNQVLEYTDGEVRNGALASVRKLARPGTEEHLKALAGHEILILNRIWPV